MRRALAFRGGAIVAARTAADDASMVEHGADKCRR